MVANVNLIYICPKCEETMSSPQKPKSCPTCDFKFTPSGEKLATKLEWPKAPSRQLFEIIQQETEKAIPKETRELLPHMPKEVQDELILSNQQKYMIVKEQWEGKKDEFFANTNPDEIEDLVKCLHYLMNHCLSSGNPEMVLKCQKWSEGFAKINEYLNLFVKNGGSVYAKPNKTTEPGDS